MDTKRSRPWSQMLRAGNLAPAGESVIAIVPAREEAEVLPITLPALLAQDHPGFRAVLVDDRSADGTGALARRLAGEAGRAERLSVVEADPPPPGWTGKVNALARGFEETLRGPGGAPEWILLTDADIRHPPDSVRALLDRARRGGHDMVSVMARLRADGFWAGLLIPPFVFFFQLLYPFRRASDPRSRTAAAAGGCVLVRRRALEAAGGLSRIAGEIIDDVALARAVRAAGGRAWLGFDPAIVSVRGYGGLGGIWRMVSRTAFVQLRRSWLLLALTVLAMTTLLIAPPLLAAAGFLAGRPAAGAAALLGWLIPSLLLVPYARYLGARGVLKSGAYAFALPVASLLYLGMTLSSAWDHARGRGPLWRGRRFAG